MENKFTDPNDFDKYAREQDEWSYDNGWGYKGEHLPSYAFDVKRFGKIESGILVDSIVMLRDDQIPNKTIVLHGRNMQLEEIWSGFVSSQDDYQAMMSVINKFIEEYK